MLKQATKALQPHQSNGLPVQLVKQFSPFGHPLIREIMTRNVMSVLLSVTIRSKLLLSDCETQVMMADLWKRLFLLFILIVLKHSETI